MMKARMLVPLVGVSILLFGGCAESVEKTAKAADQPPAVTLPTMPISINAVMVSLVDHASHEIWNAADKKKAPRSERDWTELEHHALQLAASGTLIMLPGTGLADKTWTQGEEWKKYSKGLSDAGLAAVNAARQKDLAAVMAAGDQLVVVCESCHKAYKPDVPTEGLVHPHYR
jgi:hypothetical protein